MLGSVREREVGVLKKASGFANGQKLDLDKNKNMNDWSISNVGVGSLLSISVLNVFLLQFLTILYCKIDYFF